MEKRKWVSGKWKEFFLWEASSGMEKKIFYAAVSVMMLYVFLMMVVNFLLRQYLLGTIFLICLPLGPYIMYLLRKKHKFNLPFFIFGFVAYPVLAINFYLNDGVEGTSAYVFILINLVMTSIAPMRWVFGLAIVNILFFVSTFYIGVFYPEVIPTNYPDKITVFIDHSITYLGTSLGMIFILMTVRLFYQTHKSRSEANEKELIVVNRDLTNTNAQKDKIIAILAHDLKNPLQSIMQTLEMLNETNDLTREEMDFIHAELLKNTKRTYSMMENILEWSSFELRGQNSRVREVDLKSLLGDTLEIMKSIAKQKGIALHTQFNANPILHLESDRLLLIVRNLVQNAIKFTNVGGKITFEISYDGNDTILSVEDNGIGISENQLNAIFQFEAKHTYGTAKEKGTGLGLHLCYQNAKKIGAVLSVESKEGVGSTFSLRIPGKLGHEIESVKWSTPSSL
nr:sensor histidine kinase [Cytophagales bacterium]